MSSLEESYAWCQSLAKRTGGNFHYSFLTLPRDFYRDMCALYAFMRVSDDIGDDVTAPVERRTAQLAQWRDDLRLALDGRRFHHPIYPALMEMIGRRNVPPRYLFDVIEGIESDLQPRTIESFAELERYCYFVAGAVGLCCIHLWGFHDAQAVDRAIECGTAFQLTNILRDIAEDAGAGRVYLPADELQRFGVSADELRLRRDSERLQELLAFQIRRARDYYDRSRPLIQLVNPPGRPILSAMRRIYGGILGEIERRPQEVLRRRIGLSRWKKTAIALQTVIWARLGLPVSGG